MHRARIAHVGRASGIAVIAAALLIGIEIGATWLFARVAPRPLTPGLPEGTITLDVMEWMFAVGIAGRLVSLAAMAILMARIARRVGYRARDGWFAFVPFYGAMLAVRFAWRISDRPAEETVAAPAFNGAGLSPA